MSEIHEAVSDISKVEYPEQNKGTTSGQTEYVGRDSKIVSHRELHSPPWRIADNLLTAIVGNQSGRVLTLAYSSRGLGLEKMAQRK